MANSWGASGTTWGQGDWSDQTTTTVVLSGLSITASLGTAEAFHETGWGADFWGSEGWGGEQSIFPVTGYSITATLGDLAYAAALDGWSRGTWGEDDWGDDTLTIPISGLSMTGSVGTASAYSLQGWGRATWGNEPWGESNSPVIAVTGFPITAALGELPYAQAIEGWGRDEWGIGNWGQNTTTIIIDGLEMTGHQGPDAWGEAPWDEMVSWGGGLTCETTQLSIVALTGIEATATLGTPTINYDFIFTLSESLLGTLSLGALSINNGADHTQGLGGLAITASLGTPTHEMAYDLTGIEATMSLGTIEITSTEIIYPTGLSGTLSLGSFTLPDMAVGLSGLQATGSLGTPIVTDMKVGISGLEMSGALGSGGVAPLHYKDVDITGNTSYTYVEHAS